MIRLHVRGSLIESLNAILAHNILGPVFVSEKDGATFWDVREGFREAVIRWYCEPIAAEFGKRFLVGTLLYHN